MKTCCLLLSFVCLSLIGACQTVGAITGSGLIAVGATITLADTSAHGRWSSSDTGIVRVDSLGDVTGVSAGSATISYSVPGLGSATFLLRIVAESTSSCPEIITTIAGNGIEGYSGDGGAATAAEMQNPTAIAVDRSGNIYIADLYNNVIRKVSASGIITTFAGDNLAGFSGDGGQATVAELNQPTGVALDHAGNLYIVDSRNNRIRKVDSSGIISTIAGYDSSGYSSGYSGDNGSALSALLNGPFSVAFDGFGNLFIADAGNNVIRKVDTFGIITTVAGNYSFGCCSYSGDGGPATAAALNQPLGLSLDGCGNLFIADEGNNCIRKVDTSGIISTVAGNRLWSGYYAGDGGAATAAVLNQPTDVKIDLNGNLFIADQFNSVIRKVDTNGIISTFAGDYSYAGEYGGDGGAASAASLAFPSGLAFDGSGNLIIADSYNKRIRKVAPGRLVERIYGSDSVCPGSTVTYSDSTFGGTWSSSDTSIATINSEGVVAGISRGYAIITYTASDSCGSSFVTKVITVPSSFAGIIYGSGLVAIGSTITLTDTCTGGIWNSSNNSLATVDSSGDVTGISGGIDTLSYTIANSCGSHTATFRINVISDSGLPYTCPRIIRTFAGNGIPSYSGDGGAATAAELSYPESIAVDKFGNVYITDNMNSCIRKVDTSGIITTFAGKGIYGYSGDGGPATNALLSYPQSITIDGSGNVFIADNGRVRKINTSGVISAFAGNGITGFSGDGGTATAAELSALFMVAADSEGNLYISDYYNNRIRKVDTAGIITTVAGNGIGGFSGDGSTATAAELNRPGSLTIDNRGNLFIADENNNRIRKVLSSGVISTISGDGSFGFSGDGGAATAAQFSGSLGLTVDRTGALYFSDAGNIRIRKIDTNGIIQSIAGSGLRGFSGDGEPPTVAQFNGPTGVAVAANGNVYIVDGNNQRIRSISAGMLIPDITGIDSPCVGSTTTYSVAITGGSWSSSNTSIATINDSGVVSCLAIGTVIITYSASDSCGNGIAVKSLYVTPVNAGLITGSAAVVLGCSVTLTDTAAGGYWTSSNSGVATINFLTGVVTGISIGTTTINYHISEACGSYTSSDTLNVISDSSDIYDCPRIITTLAGNGTPGFSGDGGAATSAKLSQPISVALDRVGNVYLVDYNESCVRKVDTYGIITTIVRPPTDTDAGILGDGGPATAATLLNPKDITVDDSGNIYIVDYGNSRIRRINASGIITTVAGCSYGYTGDGGPATAAGLTSPTGVIVDHSGNFYFTELNRVRKVNRLGIISSVAGNGTIGFGASGFSGDGGPATLADLNLPYFLAIDDSGNIFISDTYNRRIRKVDTAGIITSVAGNGIAGYSGDGGLATAAELFSPMGLACDHSGNLYIGDYNGSTIRKVDKYGIITTFAGSRAYGFGGDGGAATTASFNGPAGIATDDSGNMYLADVFNARIRKISPGMIVNPVRGTHSLCIAAIDTLSDSTIDGIWSSSDTEVAMVNPAGIATGEAAGSVIITYTTSNTCGVGFATHAVTVTPEPIPVAISGSGEVCAGSSLTLTGSPIGGSWLSTDTGIAVVNTGVVSGISEGSDAIKYTLINSCGTAIVSATITVNIFPIAGLIIGDTMVCNLSTTSLTATASYGVWASLDTNASVNSLGIVTGRHVGRDTLAYTVTNACGTASTTIPIYVHPLPNPGTISDTASVFCVGTHVVFSDTVAGGVWTTSDSSIASATGGHVNAHTAGIDTIFYTVTDICGSARSYKTITVSTVPVVNPIRDSSDLFSLCLGSVIKVYDSAVGGHFLARNGNVSVNDTGLVTGRTAGTDSILYTITNTCGSATTFVIVTVNPLPDSGQIFLDSAMCIGTEYLSTDTVAGGNWNADSRGVLTFNVFLDTGGHLVYYATPLRTGTDTVSYTVFNSCGSATATKVVTVYAPPSAGSITGPTVICVSAPASYTDSVSGGYWVVHPAASGSFAGGVFTPSASGQDTLLYVDTFGCAPGYARLPVWVDSIPHPVITRSHDTLYATPGYATYQWFLNGTLLSGYGSTVSASVDTGMYSVMVSDGFGCPGMSDSFDFNYLGIGTVGSDDFVEVYPNPATGMVYIRSSKPIDAELNTIDGRLLVRKKDAHNLDISALPASVYVLRIYDSGTSMILKTVRVVKVYREE